MHMRLMAQPGRLCGIRDKTRRRGFISHRYRQRPVHAWTGISITNNASSAAIRAPALVVKDSINIGCRSANAKPVQYRRRFIILESAEEKC